MLFEIRFQKARLREAGFLFKMTVFLLSTSSPGLAYDRTVKFSLPLTTPYNEQVLDKSGAKYLYPQQICLDDSNSRLFIIMATRGGDGDRSQWAGVYNWRDGKFISLFQVGTGLGETCVISANGRSSMLWVKSRGGNLLAFDVSQIPPPMSAPRWVRKSKAPVYYQSAMRNGRWVAELQTENRSAVANLNSDFRTTRSFTLTDPPGDQHDKPKRQAIAISDYGIIGSYGSNFIAGRDPKKTAYGIRVFSHDGTLLSDKVSDPVSVLDELKAQGVAAKRLENEGLLVTKSNQVYTLAITQGANTPEALSGGMVLIEETVPKLRR